MKWVGEIVQDREEKRSKGQGGGPALLHDISCFTYSSHSLSLHVSYVSLLSATGLQRSGSLNEGQSLLGKYFISMIHELNYQSTTNKPILIDQ